jgi:signal transduction histidine kinase
MVFVWMVLSMGSVLLTDDAHSGVDSKFGSARFSVATPSRQIAKPAVPDESRLDLVDSALASVGANKELFFYGGIGMIGVLLAVLVLSSVVVSSKSRTEKQVEILIQEKEKAENLARLKSEFLNQVSHELRTPLAVIIGYIECMTDGLYGQIESKHHEILQVVAKQSAHLKNMIDQILIYSRLEAGKQPLRVEDLQLTKMINEMKDTFDFLCRQKGLDLCWELPKDPMSVRSDATRLKEVISNLLQNAVKYTDHGSVTVRMEKLAVSNSVKIEVADTGMGISEQHLTSIFEPFMQAHKTSTTNNRGGIGLGLSIVKKHLEQIRGTIQVESELGKGSTFQIVLPLKYETEKSKTSWFGNLLKFRPVPTPTASEPPIGAAHAETGRQKAVDARHAMG